MEMGVREYNKESRTSFIKEIFLRLVFIFFLIFPLMGYSRPMIPLNPRDTGKTNLRNYQDFPLDSCQSGSIGDPIVHIDFGSGAALFGPPLGSGITNLAFVSNQCPSDGQYTITNYSQSCFNNTWQSTKDHTGNPNGYFMLINANYVPNDFYVQQVDGLCEGTSFQFSSWILNMKNGNNGDGIYPNVTYTIEKLDGTILKTFKTGDIPVTQPATWKQFAFSFTLPQGISSIILRLRNNAPGGNGNDIALDDITFQAIGPKINTQIQGQAKDSLVLCQGQFGPLQFNSTVETCYFNTDYQWQFSGNQGKTWTDIPGANSTQYQVKITDTGSFNYRMAAAQQGNISSILCRVYSPPIFLKVYPVPNPSISILASAVRICQGTNVVFKAKIHDGGSKPQFQWFLNGNSVGISDSIYSNNSLQTDDEIRCSLTTSLPCSGTVNSLNAIDMVVSPIPGVMLSPEINLNLGKNIQLSPQYSGNIVSYIWSPSKDLNDPNSPNPIASPLYDTRYWVKVLTQAGCSDSAFTDIKVINDLDIPNSFSPNRDGINDTWYISHLTDFPNCTVDIFNRYGQLVFHSLGYGTPWDGTFGGILMPLGTYYYVINLHNGYRTFSGPLTLIR